MDAQPVPVQGRAVVVVQLPAHVLDEVGRQAHGFLLLAAMYLDRLGGQLFVLHGCQVSRPHHLSQNEVPPLGGLGEVVHGAV